MTDHGVREDIESLDYDIDASSIFEQELRGSRLSSAGATTTSAGWCACIGCGTGAVAFLIDVLTMGVLKLKYNLSARAAEASDDTSGAFFPVLEVTFAGLSMLYVAFSAALVVFIEPVAGGSGIPEVKTYLQGVKVPRRWRDHPHLQDDRRALLRRRRARGWQGGADDPRRLRSSPPGCPAGLVQDVLVAHDVAQAFSCDPTARLCLGGRGGERGGRLRRAHRRRPLRDGGGGDVLVRG